MIESLSSVGVGFSAVVMKLLSYFTILTNSLLLVRYGTSLLVPSSRLGRFMSSPAFDSALLLYISLVGSLYLFLIAPIWHTEGLQSFANAILHYADPLLYIGYWIFFVPKQKLPWKLSIIWLGYPLVYLFWILGRGALLGDYPYFFMNPVALGYGMLVIYAIALGVVFFGCGLGIIALSRFLSRNSLRGTTMQES